MMNNLSSKRKYFDITDGGFSTILFIVFQYILIFLAVLVLPRNIRQNDYLSTFLNVILEALFVCAPLVVSRFKKTDFKVATMLNNKVNGKIVGYALGISIVCLYLFTNLTSVFISLLDLSGYTTPYAGTEINNFGDWALGIITICVIPAFCEEMLFRGVVLNSFRGLNKWIGIVVSGVAFMLMHGNPDQTVHQLILGLVLGYIAWETRNIWITVLIHFFNNFIAITLNLALAYMPQDGAGSAEGPVSAGSIIYTLIIGLILAAGGIWLVYKLTIKLKAVNAELNKKEEQPAQKIETEVTVTNNVAGQDVQSNSSVTVKVDITDPNQDIREVQPKPSKLKIALCVGSYVCFAAYFIYEWISVLLEGLGL